MHHGQKWQEICQIPFHSEERVRDMAIEWLVAQIFSQSCKTCDLAALVILISTVFSLLMLLIIYLLSCHTFTPIEKRAIFSKLHAFCSLRDVRNCTLSKRPRRALPNQVKLHPSNERPRLGYASQQQLKMAAQLCERSRCLLLGLFLCSRAEEML